MKIIQYSLCALLSIHLIWRGIVPALTRVDTDFPNYYTSAKLLVQGNNLDRLYDDDWFQTQIRASGTDQMGKFSPYPPVTAFVMIPVVWFSPLTALRIWTAVNLICLIVVIHLLSGTHHRGFLFSALIVLLSGHALVNNFRFGQFYLILTLLLILGYRAWMSDHQRPAGMFFGVGAAVKYFPVLFFPLFLARREWKTVVSAVATVLVIWAGGLLIIGRHAYEKFFSAVLGPHLAGDLQNPFGPTFQSWNSLLRRLFIFDSTLNAHPLINSPILYSCSLFLIYSMVVVIVAVALRTSHVRFGDGASDVQFSLLCVAGLLLLPASATYHFLLLILPVVLLATRGKWKRSEQIVIVCFVLIGFIPYRYTSWFDGKGILTLFAYPRLILATVIFFATSAIARRGPVMERVSRSYPTSLAHDYSA